MKAIERVRGRIIRVDRERLSRFTWIDVVKADGSSPVEREEAKGLASCIRDYNFVQSLRAHSEASARPAVTS
jgi:hypothetical protein